MGLLIIAFVGVRLSTLYVPPRAKALLYVSPERLDLGEVLASRHYDCTVPIKNLSAAPVTITEIRASCGCTRIDPSSFTLQAGQSRDLTFTLDLARGANRTGTVESFSVSFVPVIKDGLLLADGWELRGQIKPTYVIDTSHIVFDGATRLIAQQSHPTAKIPIRRFMRKLELSVDCHSHLGHATLIGSQEADNSEILFTPSSSLEAGMHFGDLTLSAYCQGMSLGDWKIALQLNVVGIAEAIPRQLDLGPVSVGGVIDSRILITSAHGDPFRILEDIGQEAALEINADHQEAAAAHWVTIRIVRTEEGKNAINALVAITDGANLTEVLGIPISYNGTLQDY